MLRQLPLCALAASLTTAGCFSEPPVEQSTEETDSSTPSEGTATEVGSGTSVNATGGTEGKSGTATSATAADTTDGTDTEHDTTSGGDSDSDTGPLPPTVCPNFIDTFDDAAIDPLWRQSFPASTSEVDGELFITVTGALNDEYVTMVVLPEGGGLEGGTMRVELGTTPADVGVRTTLWIQPTNSQGRISYNLVDRGAGLQLEARISPKVGGPQLAATLPWDPDTMGWLQLRETGGVLYFEVSNNGVAFELFHEMPTPFDVGSAEVGFAGHNDNGLPSDVEVSVETFEFICG